MLDNFGARITLLDKLTNAGKPDGNERELRCREETVHADEKDHAEDVERSHGSWEILERPRAKSGIPTDPPPWDTSSTSSGVTIDPDFIRAPKTKGEPLTACSKCATRGCNLPLRSEPGAYARIEVAGFATRVAEGSPAAGGIMLRDIDNLSDVICVVRDLPVDGLHHGMPFAAVENRPAEVSVR